MKKTKKTQKTTSASSSRSHKFSGLLSLVIPCYNESERIPAMLETLKRFEGKWKANYEVIIVNDGSSDDTLELLKDKLHTTLSKAKRLEFVDVQPNKGKGNALKEGMTYADGDFILTLDADMAASPNDLNNWLQKLPGKTFKNNEILIGSREHEQSKVDGNPLRKIMGVVFNLIIQILTPLNNRDTQCGFKLYPKAIGKQLFKELRFTGWAHDVEILYRAHQKGIPIKSMPVSWKHIEGTKIKVAKDSFMMAIQVFLISIMTKVDHFFIKPLNSLKSGGEEGKESPIFRLLFAVLAIALLFAMPLMSPDFGISGDEQTQHVYGQKLVKYYQSNGENKEALEFKNLKYYGGLFDYAVTWLNTDGKVGQFKYDPYEFRHVMNSLVGFFLILLTGLLAFRLSDSWKIAFLALLFMAFSPRIFGHSMNNPKDIPFAAAVIFTLLFIVRFLKELPRPGWGTSIFLASAIGLAINFRVGGMLMIAYLFLFTFVAYLLRKDLRVSTFNAKVLPSALMGVAGMAVVGGVFYYLMKTNALPITLVALLSVAVFSAINSYLPGKLAANSSFKTAWPAIRVFNYLVMITFGGLAIGTWFWPYAALDPINNMLESLDKMADFETAIRVLFGSEHIWSDKVSWNYIPQWMGITSPIFILLGIVLFAAGWFIKRKEIHPLWMVFVLFVTIFPVAYAVIQESSLYDGMRHFLFVYPTLAVIAAMGWGFLTSFKGKKAINMGLGALLALLIALPGYWMVKNHPYQYMYFNELFGGVENAYGNYETDYWQNSMKGLCDKFVEMHPEFKTNNEIKIATNCLEPVAHYLRLVNPNIRPIQVKFETREQKDWDYGFFYSRFINKDYLKSGVWPAEQVEYVEKVDGAPVGVITKRKSKAGIAAWQAFRQGNQDGAIASYQQILAGDPKNASAMMGIIQASLNKRDFPTARKYLDQVLKLSDTYVSAVGMNGLYYLNTGEVGNAERELKRAVDLNYKYTNGHFYLATIYQQQGKLDEAIKHIEIGKDYAGRFKQFYKLASDLYNQKGNKGMAQQYLKIFNSL